MFVSPWKGDALNALYTRVFAAPSIILNSSGSVGMTFVMWIVGALVAAAGTAVYVEFGTVRFTLRFVGRAPHFALV
jgi:hypothetical protein